MYRRVISCVIETGTVTSMYHCCRYAALPQGQCLTITLLTTVFAVVTMSLAFLSGQQTYYEVPSAILAKI